MRNQVFAVAIIMSSVLTLACSEGPPPPQLTFEEFRQRTPRDSEGSYIVEWDLVARNDEELRPYYEALVHRPKHDKRKATEGSVQQSLHTQSWSQWVKNELWAPDMRRNLTYCIDAASFGGNLVA